MFTFSRIILRHLRRNLQYTKGSQLFAFLTVSLSILVFIFFYLLYSNLMSVGVRLNDEIKIVVYLEDSPSAAMRERLETKIRDFGDVEEVNFVSSEEAYERLKKQLGSRTSILDGLPENFLPPSIEIYPNRELRALASLDTFVKYLYDLPSAKKVQYGQQWIDRFQQFMFILRTIIVMSAVLLSIALTYTVAYTIRLVIAARKDELQYCTLIGAPPSLIQMPFVLEGMLQGLFGSLFGVFILYVLYRWSLMTFSDSSLLSAISVSFLSVSEIVAVVACSIAFCAVGSFTSVRRYMKTTETQ